MSSCNQQAPEATLKAENETAKPASPPKLEPKSASFSLSGLTITPGEVTTGSPVTIEVLVTNMGELPGTYDVILRIDDTMEATKKVTLEGGSSQKVTFTSTKFTAKTYSVSINGQSGTFVIKASSPPSPPTPPTPPLPPLDAFQKGITFAAWKSFDAKWPGMYTPPGAGQSLRDLATTGANWISIPVTVGQETIASTKIFRDSPATATDSELRRMIDLAHSLGMRVMLRPGIALSNDPGHWGGQIGTAFISEDQWQDWFTSYREFINHYATFSQEAGVDMLNIGWEYGGTTHREADWRRVIQEVRQRYKGPITYSSLDLPSPGATFPHGEDARIKWWDAVDYIGVDVWPLLTNKNDPTVEELKAVWTNSGYIARLESLSARLNKAIIFTEIGYPSFDGVNKLPAVLQPAAPVDLQEQADCYQAALEVFWGKPWLAGMFWFQWRAEPGVGGLNDNGDSLNGKPVIEILKKFYLSK